jgi:hypothetical protein
MEFLEQSDQIFSHSSLKSFSYLKRTRGPCHSSDGTPTPRKVDVLTAVVEPSDFARQYDHCSFNASISQERGFSIAHFILETEETRIVWLANARDAEIQKTVEEWKSAGHVYVDLYDRAHVASNDHSQAVRELTAPFAMSPSFELPEPVDYSNQTEFRRQAFAAFAAKLVDEQSLQSAIDNPVFSRQQLISANVLMMGDSQYLVNDYLPSSQHDALSNKLLYQEQYREAKYAQLTEVARVARGAHSLPFPNDAMVLTARLQYPIASQHQGVPDGQLEATELTPYHRGQLIFVFQTENVRLNFVCNAADPETWKAIDCWNMYGKAFVSLEFEDQHYLLTPQFEHLKLTTARPDCADLVFPDSQTFQESRFARLSLDDTGMQFFFYDVTPDFGTSIHGYQLVYFVQSKTHEKYRAFLEEPSDVREWIGAPVGCAGINSSAALETIRAKGQNEVCCAVIPTTMLPEEVQALVQEEECLCITLPEDFVENSELSVKWSADVYTRVNYEATRKSALISFGSGHVEVFFDRIFDFLEKIQAQCPVLFLRRDGWFLKIYHWTTDYMDVALWETYFFGNIEDDDDAEAELAKNRAQQEGQNENWPLLATHYLYPKDFYVAEDS